MREETGALACCRSGVFALAGGERTGGRVRGPSAYNARDDTLAFGESGVSLRLYSTLSRTVEEFRPAGEEVRTYVCGVTPYDTAHLGHAFLYVSFDVLHRFLRYLGYRVRYIQNITDIDNDILRKANEVGEPWDELGNRYVKIHQAALDALNVEPPVKYPRATEEIPLMVEMIDALIARGHAYEASGSVYFRVASDPSYGCLSRLSPDEMAVQLTETGDPADDPLKESPLDFLLWQAAKPGEPTWPSPWGPGRPGWHIECSAMAIRYLGETLDIHGGGGDLVYPHHESEIAQSECWSGQRPFAQVWMHAGMLRMDGEKMSKSLGNMVFVHDLVKQHRPEAIRLLLSGVRYRDVLEWSADKLAACERVVDLLEAAAGMKHPVHDDAHPYQSSGTPVDPEPFRQRFVAALEDDLNTPVAIVALRELAEAIVAGREGARPVSHARHELRVLAGILGIALPVV
jgi:L-cysteine:1D-myo-inositol 2-amino-2-deoxy-alpha-D-glucopyranoside ligase